MNKLSLHPNSAGRRDRARYTVFVNLGTLHARAGIVGKGNPGEVEVRRFRKPEGLDNYRAVVRNATRLNQTRRKGAA